MNQLTTNLQVRLSFPLFRVSLAVWIALLIVCILTGCAAVGKKFEATPKVDMTLFADNTMAMLNDLGLVVARNETVYIRQFMDASEPEEMKLQELSLQTRRTLFDVVQYSLHIVSLAESGRTEPEKVAAYGDYLAEYLERFKAWSIMPADYLEERLALIRQQQDFLGALRTAQPIINAVGMQTSIGLNDIIRAVEAVASKLDRQIDAAYADVNRYKARLQNEKFTILKSLDYIHKAYGGDKDALRELKAKGYVWDAGLLPKGDSMTYKQLQALIEHFSKRLDAQHRIQQEIEPELKEYRETHQELIRLQDESMRRIGKTRIIMMVWVRAHQKMATGVTDPAEWFDIKQTPKMLIDMGKGVIF